ncbi:MAG: Hpt domain-containing protein [Rhodospirillaceae bacterium]|jgi:chemotaxis protein histidine kinase CheA|nr:Hpt domain-containing protein [Rhodospirillaceae bacterium]MBT5192878.1 Hpt domain-containing protein [Rhodospirillaceae bacterium]MBT5895065.1 Hpt domain-containing protein [Rhodospirillaceae bacterium]MBT6429551.1 Hpt domain-containing protein [Rhodospirillaceae bacterium]
MTDETEDKPVYEVEFIPPSYELKTKAPMTEQRLSPALSKIEDSLEKLKSEYLVWFKSDFERLQGALKSLVGSPNCKRKILDIYRISHDMKGQAGTFDYELVTDILHNLCEYLEDRDAVDADELHVIELHVNAVKLVVDTALTGRGGEVGEKLLQGLAAIVDSRFPYA